MADTFSILSFPKGIPSYPEIFIHSSANKELIDLFEVQPASKARLLAKLKQRLQFLQDHMGNEQKHRQWFEILTKKKSDKSSGIVLRSIIFKEDKLLANLRILYCIERKNAYILCVFQERGPDYRHAMEVARKRYKDIPCSF